MYGQDNNIVLSGKGEDAKIGPSIVEDDSKEENFMRLIRLERNQFF